MKAVQEPKPCFAQETRISVLYGTTRMFIISVEQTPRIHLAAVQTATVSWVVILDYAYLAYGRAIFQYRTVCHTVLESVSWHQLRRAEGH